MPGHSLGPEESAIVTFALIQGLHAVIVCFFSAVPKNSVSPSRVVYAKADTADPLARGALQSTALRLRQ